MHTYQVPSIALDSRGLRINRTGVFALKELLLFFVFTHTHTVFYFYEINKLTPSIVNG